MDSRIILTKADFSANNIGRYVEISDLTKKVLSKQTQYDEQSEEAAALNTFLNSLTTDGFIGGDAPKLSVLLIPALAASQSELFFNIAKLDENGAPTNWMPTNSSKYSIDSNGTYNIGAYANASISDGENAGFSLGKTYFSANSKMPSFSLFNYLYQVMGGSSPETRPISQYGNSVYIDLNASNCCAGVISGTAGTNQAKATTSMSSSSVGFYSMSYDGNDGSIIVNNVGNAANEQISVQGGITLASIGNVNTDFRLLFGNSNTIASAHTSIVGFGNALTQSELGALKTYCDTLASELHIIN